MKRLFLLLSAVILCSSFSLDCSKKPSLKNSRWTAGYEQFVADAGTQTTTVSLEFISAREYVLKIESILPPHPSMYRNADGSIDMQPGMSWEDTSKGTYKIKRDAIVLTDEKGKENILLQVNGQLHNGSIASHPLTFTRVEN